MTASLIVMFIVLGGHITPIQGWHSMEACKAASERVTSEVKARQGSASYVDVKVHCLAFPNPE